MTKKNSEFGAKFNMKYTKQLEENQGIPERHSTNQKADLNRGKQIFLLHKIAQHYKDIKTFRQCLWK
jgi:hypothetical protein